MKLSLMDLGDRIADPVTGADPTPAERHRAIVEAAAVADEAGFHGVHIGEHHGLDYIYSAPPVILAAIAERTRNLRLSTAVTLAANLDPVRAAEDYATVDVLSGGRCEVVVGRGNIFAATFTLFGQRVEDSAELFAERVELLIRLWSGETVNWPGSRHRAAITGFELQPPPTGGVPLWVGGGSSVATIELAARLGLDLMLPSVFGNPANFKPMVESYREKFAAYGHAREPKVGAAWLVNVGETSQGARARWEPRYRTYFESMARMLTRANPETPPFAGFDFEHVTTHGPALVGSPDELADRLNRGAELLTADTNLISLNVGGLPTGEFLDMIELIGEKVIPQLH
ncbi:LLM class flavin-dependent oxidoreductase [Amycolatopsis pithecellobii]|uniref:LLM class flavin-dependent oxidoreductase n=1 Tax=Amycolatopsis pithecellobii TaxID=664692 RepID=A0A6N7YYT7_9PSEU|nr:LLM class flavin-dependent oxidoreductase [Amycolatopsis pithecellobii]MTD54063.1 LLM class flavin-dependent oxidoreductase [Amycolatopsis pithecellobii]